MALLHMSHPTVQTCGVGDILYFCFSWAPQVLDSISNPLFGRGAWLHNTSIRDSLSGKHALERKPRVWLDNLLLVPQGSKDEST